MPGKQNNNKKGKKNQKPKNKGSNNRKTVRQAPQFLAPGQGLSGCALKYATAIAEPWSPMAQGACIPTFPSRASQKSTGWVRTTGQIGASGTGFICVSPCLANNKTALYCTTGTFTGGQILLNSTTLASGAWTQSSVNTPWTAGALTSNFTTVPPAVSGRMVSVGLSVQYTGTVFNQGGLYYALTEPNHGNLNGFTAAQLNAYQETTITRSDSKKTWLTCAGMSEREVQYAGNGSSVVEDELLAQFPYCSGLYLDPSKSGEGGIIMVICVTGVPLNTFEVELVQHMEFVGAATSTMATPTHSDATGFQMVNTASNRIPQLKVSMPNASHSSLMNTALSMVAQELKPVVRVGASMAGKMIGTYIGGPAGGALGGTLGGSAMKMIGM